MWIHTELSKHTGCGRRCIWNRSPWNTSNTSKRVTFPTTRNKLWRKTIGTHRREDICDRSSMKADTRKALGVTSKTRDRWVVPLRCDHYIRASHTTLLLSGVWSQFIDKTTQSGCRCSHTFVRCSLTRKLIASKPKLFGTIHRLCIHWGSKTPRKVVHQDKKGTLNPFVMCRGHYLFVWHWWRITHSVVRLGAATVTRCWCTQYQYPVMFNGFKQHINIVTS